MSAAQLRQLSVFLACVAAVFFVPYLFPPHAGISTSVMAGFSNRAAQVVLLGGSLVFALWTRGWGLRLAQTNAPTRQVWQWAVPAATAMLVGVTCLYLWHWASNMGPYDEAIYFLDRFSNQLAGGRVYRDFDFDYGPLLYYPAWWIASLLRIPVGHAYYLFWMGEWIVGVVLLWQVIGALRARPLDRVVTFAAVALTWYTSITDQGAQYTPFRFIVTSVCALWVYGLWRGRAAIAGSARFLPAMLAAACCFTLLLLFSPEQGIGFALATALFFAIGVRERSVALPLAGFLLFCIAVFAIAARLGFLQSLFTFAGGAFNLPLLPGPHTLFLIPMLLVAGCLVIASLRNGESHRPELYLIALALVAVPAGFGRADGGHIFINSMPALIVVTLALLQVPSSAGVVLAGWVLYLFGAYSGHLRPALNVLMHSWPRVEMQVAAAQTPPPGAVLRAPIRYFSYLDGQFGPKVITGRYYGYDLVYPGLAEQKIAELEAHPRDLVVVPADYRRTCEMDSVEEARTQLRDAFQSFYTPNLHAVPNVKAPLCDFLQMHYMRSPYRVPREEYRVLQPRAFPTAPAFTLPAGVAPEAAGRVTANRLP